MIRRPYNQTNQTETFDQRKRTVKASRRRFSGGNVVLLKQGWSIPSFIYILYIYAAGGIRARPVEESWFNSRCDLNLRSVHKGNSRGRRSCGSEVLPQYSESNCRLQTYIHWCIYVYG